jgi:hypothetical protein
MLTIISHLRNANQQHNEMPLSGSYYQKMGGRKKKKGKKRKKRKERKSGVMAHAYYPRIEEAESGECQV